MKQVCVDQNNGLDVIHLDKPFGSDHMSFNKRQIEAVLTINADDEAYDHYHKSTDTIQNVNFDYAVKIARMNMGTLIRMAGVAVQGFLARPVAAAAA